MAKLFSFSAATFLLFGSASAAFAESADFETNGFPISVHQAQVTGLSDIRERAPTATLTVYGMPASPHQLLVLLPRDDRDDEMRHLAGTIQANPATVDPIEH